MFVLGEVGFAGGSRPSPPSLFPRFFLVHNARAHARARARTHIMPLGNDAHKVLFIADLEAALTTLLGVTTATTFG